MIPRVEVGAVELEVGGQQLAEHPGAAPHVVHGAEPGFHVAQLAVFFHQLHQVHGREYREQHADDHHFGDAGEFAAAYGFVNVKGHRLVLGFLDGMPGPDRGNAWIHLFQSVVLEQEFFSHQRSEMFHRDGVGELTFRAQMFAQQIHETQDFLLQPCQIHAAFLQEAVHQFMLAGVVRFLADKALDGFLQFRVGNLILVVTHRINEKALTGRETGGHGSQQQGFHRIVVPPVARYVLRLAEGELGTANLGNHVLGAFAGQGAQGAVEAFASLCLARANRDHSIHVRTPR